MLKARAAFVMFLFTWVSYEIIMVERDIYEVRYYFHLE